LLHVVISDDGWSARVGSLTTMLAMTALSHTGKMLGSAASWHLVYWACMYGWLGAACMACVDGFVWWKRRVSVGTPG
jgi:hypothetical protein